MLSSLEKLKKYFTLERQTGFNDQAIIGGLGKILDAWTAEARNEGVSEDIIEAVSSRLRDYHSLTPQGRADSLKGLWKRIEATGGIPSSETVTQVTDETGSDARPKASPTSAAVARETRSTPEKLERPASRPVSDGHPSRSKPAISDSVAGAKASGTPAALNASLTVLSGVGPRHASTLEKLGLHTLGDMLYFFPRRYDDYSQLKPINRLWYGEQVTVIGMVQSVAVRQVRGGKMQIIETILSDGTGAIRITFFNQPWLANRLSEGMAISVSGKIEQYLGRLVLNNPDWEPVEVENLHTNRIVPVYPLTATVTQKWLRGLMNQVVTYWGPRVADPLPESIKSAESLNDLGPALVQSHFPDSQAALKAARERLAFDEIFYLQMGVLRQKRDWQSATARIYEVEDAWLEGRISLLPFELTAAQKRVIDDIRTDLKAGKPMNRLIQGDVGSGKTVVAALAVAMINRSGAQTAIMAPTGILAEQHYRSFLKLLGKIEGEDRPEDYLQPEQVRLLVGNTSATERKEIFEGLANGFIKVLIGTHALIEDPVQFNDLQLTVIDEQHRFGVEQRAALRSKGSNPHLLVMTATPIPRSLALTLYGDLDLSVMDEMPVGRLPVATYVLTPRERERAYSLIRSQVQNGQQVFIVYPLIEESEKSEQKAAVEEHERLQKEIFPKLKLGLLHGKMKPDEKDEVMAQFRDRQFDILVSTTVIEVGVDVPNATVMLIEGANMFGLAQLHQLRGRVGRGGGEAFCLLIPDHEDAIENERLQAMAQSNDGFVLAELDLKQRGPGEFLGTRQAGFASTLKMASLTDVTLIEKARNQAQNLFNIDPDLQDPEHTLLHEAVERFWGGSKGDVS
jgi:ATP-dependent DNA helicase RecG